MCNYYYYLHTLYRNSLSLGSQMVTINPLTPMPACANQILVYECQIHFPALIIRWQSPKLGSLGFTASEDEVGTIYARNNGRIIANLTQNIGSMMLRSLASTLTIHPPLGDTNGTQLTCTGVRLVEDISTSCTISISGK